MVSVLGMVPRADFLGVNTPIGVVFEVPPTAELRRGTCDWL